MSDESDTAISSSDVAVILQIIAGIIENVDVVGEYIGTEDRYVVDVEATLRRIAQHLYSKAVELATFP